MNAPSSVRPDTSGIEVSSFRVEELAGLVRMCGECIYKELVSIGRSHPDALVQHSQSVIDQIDTLADILCETAAKIRGDAETLSGWQVPAVACAKRFPSETQWREYQAATAATTSSLDRKGMRSPATSPWSAAAATPTRALYRWVNGLPVCRELATLAPIMWQHSLSVVLPLNSLVTSIALECRCRPKVR